MPERGLIGREAYPKPDLLRGRGLFETHNIFDKQDFDQKSV